jgi:plastocyanin
MLRRIVSVLLCAAPSWGQNDKPKTEWVGAELPLTLSVKTPEDLAFKAAAERQYLIVNLLLSGKQAFDRRDYAKAVEQWEALLSMKPDVTPSVTGTVQALVDMARAKAPGLPSRPVEAAVTPQTPATLQSEEFKKLLVQVSGTISGGGAQGPGGAVVLLRKADGATPKPKASKAPVVVQKDKRFSPRVVGVPLGAAVEFRNEDDIAHNVFSLTSPNRFDLGLYKSGAPRTHTFEAAGPVHLLCNIHAAMQGWIYVADTPWYAQADVAGKFTVKNVPPGLYEMEVWHERASQSVKRQVRVSEKMEPVVAQVDGDKRPPPFVPDKSGQPRQEQLGY